MIYKKIYGLGANTIYFKILEGYYISSLEKLTEENRNSNRFFIQDTFVINDVEYGWFDYKYSISELIPEYILSETDEYDFIELLKLITYEFVIGDE